jgi:ArsR family metal-binding transcriptional regulator
MVTRVEVARAGASKDVFVEVFEITETLPCIATPGYIRFVAKADKKLDEIIPVLFVKSPPGRVNYTAEEKILTLRLFNRLITFFPEGTISVTNTRDMAEAREILQKIGDIINEAYRDYLRYGQPDKEEMDKVNRLTWMDIYNCLPKTNCKACGYQVCSAFAAKAILGEVKLSDCKPLKEPKYSQNVEKMRQKMGKWMLSSLGLES